MMLRQKELHAVLKPSEYGFQDVFFFNGFPGAGAWRWVGYNAVCQAYIRFYLEHMILDSGKYQVEPKEL